MNKSYDTLFVPGGSLDEIATNQTAADDFANYLDQLAKTGWTVEHVFQVTGGLLFVVWR